VYHHSLSVRISGISQALTDNFRFYISLLFLSIASSTAAAITYGKSMNDIPTAISLASYIATCCSLFLALFAIGEHIGLKKPDEDFVTAYDWNSRGAIWNRCWRKPLEEAGSARHSHVCGIHTPA
jgi:hypothetical protein